VGRVPLGEIDSDLLTVRAATALTDVGVGRDVEERLRQIAPDDGYRVRTLLARQEVLVALSSRTMIGSLRATENSPTMNRNSYWPG